MADDNSSGEPDNMNDEDLKALQPKVPPIPAHKPSTPNVDHPYGDGTHGTKGGEPLDRLGAGQKYGE